MTGIQDTEDKENPENEEKTEVEGFEIFTTQNLIFLGWFLAIYFLLYLGIRTLVPTNGGLSFVSRAFDLVILGLLALSLFYFFFYESPEQQKNGINLLYDTIQSFVNEKTSILWTFGFIFLLYVILFVTGTPMSYEAKPITIMIIETIAWILIVLEILVQFFKYILKVDLSELFAKFLNSLNITPTPPVKETPAGSGVKKDVPEKPKEPKTTVNVQEAKEEVFNVNNNLYTYSDARAVCKSFGARLANYVDMERAYENGAEWCSYGWSEDQMAFYPTQESTWYKLQKDPKRRNKCGRPGVNGGFMANPYLRLGVNCYGKKPKPTEEELEKMKREKLSYGQPSDEEQEEAAKMELWQLNRDKLLNINAFNMESWNDKRVK